MPVLLDTNILARLTNTADVLYPVAARAVTELHRRGEILHVTAQNLVEFRSVATRPQPLNGLGLSSAEAAFPLLAETPDIYPAWKALVQTLGVVGKQVHDARLVAVCHAHGVAQWPTLNVGHFARLAAAPPGVVVLDPATV